MSPSLLRTCTRALQTLSRSSRSLPWLATGKPQQTLAAATSCSGTALHSGASTTARLLPAMAGEGRYFVAGPDRVRIPATIDHVVESPLCTTLSGGGVRVRTVEHLLSALEGVGVDNCRIEIHGGDEVPLLDGSAKEWVANIEQVGLCAAEDCTGNSWERMAPILHEPIYVRRNDAFIVAVPSSQVHITYGIDFPEVPDILCQWFSCVMDASTYIKDIASARTFCIFEEIEKLRGASLIQGGSKENAIICSATAGWLNPPLRFDNEPCRHKVLDLIGDVSLFAQKGNQGIPLAQIIAYKLELVGLVLYEELRALLLLSSLPDSWEALVVAVDNSFREKFKLSNVTSPILGEEARRRTVGEAEGSDNALNVEDRGRENRGQNMRDIAESREPKQSLKSLFKRKCFNHEIYGHRKADC